MWCDNFDGDLYRLVPQAEEIIAPIKDVELVTRGLAASDGTLNHPACWNTACGLTVARVTRRRSLVHRNVKVYVEQHCRVCGCTDSNCRDCYVRTGEVCHWVDEDLCSACEMKQEAQDEYRAEYSTEVSDE